MCRADTKQIVAPTRYHGPLDAVTSADANQ